MSKNIHISEPTSGDDSAKRLNTFAGRHLSEQEFEMLQAYVDDRIRPLATTLPNGIFSGLELRVGGTGSDTHLRIEAGLALTGGQMIRLYYPMTVPWTDLVEQVEESQDKTLRNGIYLITVRTAVESVDYGDDVPPCTRMEEDPLRDKRIETVVFAGLQFVSANPRLLAMPQSRTANRACVRFLKESPFDIVAGSAPIGLVKVIDGLPEWIDATAGRYVATENSPYHTLLAHSVAVMEAWSRAHDDADSAQSLLAQLQLDFLPAAGVLPELFLQNVAANPPTLGFAPYDLQMELTATPASTIEDVIQRELPRGTIDLVHGLNDRMRLLLAIDDQQYRHDLMDLPQRDIKLEEEFYQRRQQAQQAWYAWMAQWLLLYESLTAAELEELKAPIAVTATITAATYRNALVQLRRDQMVDDDAALPEPYISHLNAPYAFAAESSKSPTYSEAGLYAQLATLKSEIDALEDSLDESFKLINELDDLLILQRQGRDNISLSFSNLAGGMAGDGSGKKLMRWNKNAIFIPQALVSTEGE